MDRNYIINHSTKSEFMNFLSRDSDGKINELLNAAGLDILKNSSLLEERIRYIIHYSKYKNDLFKNEGFLNILLNSNIDYYALFGNLEEDAYNNILDGCIKCEKDPEIIANIFIEFSEEYQVKTLKNRKLNEKIVYSILKASTKLSVIQSIIDNYNIDLTKHYINLYSFFEKALNIFNTERNKDYKSKSVFLNVPSSMLTKDVAKKIWNEYDIFKVRKLINNANFCTDTTYLNDYIKDKEKSIIENYNDKTLLSPFFEIYNSFVLYLNTDQNDENYYKYKMNYLKLVNKYCDDGINIKLMELYSNNGFESVRIYLENLSNNCLSNYIIDYYFEENFHNIIIDVRELLNFYFNGNISLPMDRIDIYNRISNIDYLSIQERKDLYHELKNINIMEMFYEDMHYAREIVSKAIKDYSISKDGLKEYENIELSQKYGIPVYVLNGEPFFGIVKTGSPVLDELPTGHSYSLVGCGGVSVFGGGKDSDTFLYDSDSMNEKQLVHVFPFDSFTLYKPFKYYDDASRRVNVLNMPDEIMEISSGYTELLFLEKGYKETEFDSHIPRLKKIALYCLDEINENDVKVAKTNDIGIVLINSSKYNVKQNNHINSELYHIGEYSYNYFNGLYDKKEFEKRR